MAQWKLTPTRQDPGNKVCIVFIHGFQGDPTATWAEFPRLLAGDPNITGWDVLSLGYESGLAPDLTGIWWGKPSIQTIADSLAAFVRVKLAAKYDAIGLIAHSMGGLAVQRFLLDHLDRPESVRIDKVIVFGTPSFGLAMARPFQLPILRSLNRQLRDMGKESDFLRSLRDDWDARFAQPWPGFLAVAGSEDEFVPSNVSLGRFPDRQCAVVPGNHLQIVKPEKAGDASVRVVVDFVQGKDTLWGRCGTAALAFQRGKFQEVETLLGANRTELDSLALVDLALALDGLGKRAEAMEALGDAKRHGTDAMGVLGGRHKRNWIETRKDREARSAIELYHEAYEIAAAKGDAAQAYYHGINLAFFALVYVADRAKARRLAGKVLEHCAQAKSDERPQDRMWRLATEGEANLILGESDTALERYRQAFEGPPRPKPWQFTSTSQQALRVADELGDEQVAGRLFELFGGPRS